LLTEKYKEVMVFLGYLAANAREGMSSNDKLGGDTKDLGFMSPRKN
jgi:hypothetical protein